MLRLNAGKLWKDRGAFENVIRQWGNDRMKNFENLMAVFCSRCSIALAVPLPDNEDAYMLFRFALADAPLRAMPEYVRTPKGKQVMVWNKERERVTFSLLARLAEILGFGPEAVKRAHIIGTHLYNTLAEGR